MNGQATSNPLADLRALIPRLPHDDSWLGEVDAALKHAEIQYDAEARSKILRLRQALERERTAACAWIDRIGAEVRKRRLISQSRGPYEWDDDTYMKEFGAALDAIAAALGKAESETNARSFTDCPTTQAEVDAAREPLRLPGAPGELRAIREKLGEALAEMVSQFDGYEKTESMSAALEDAREALRCLSGERG